MDTLKSPEACNSKKEIRDQIDAIDAEIIRLFARRFTYVQEIVRFKTDEASIIAQDRKNDVIRQRGIWASEAGLDKHTYEHIYRYLIDHNIDREMEILQSKMKKSAIKN